MSYLYFNEINNPGRKTKRWEVTATASAAVLGYVSFMGAWRKYVFMPIRGSLFDAACLREIADFTEARTIEWQTLQTRPNSR